MATRVSAAADLERELLTATDFFNWLEPGRHADLLNFLDRLLGTYVDRHRLAVLYREVVAILPDLAFYRAGREEAIKPTHIVEAPDLVMEVLLPRTADRDIGPKFAEYEQHGVREIDSTVVSGFFLSRAWLDPTALPRIDEAISIIEGRQ